MAKRRAYQTSQARQWEREQQIANEPAYVAYLDRLYARHGLIEPRKAVLAELIPLLSANESEKLARLMAAAGYQWHGLTDKWLVK